MAIRPKPDGSHRLERRSARARSVEPARRRLTGDPSYIRRRRSGGAAGPRKGQSPPGEVKRFDRLLSCPFRGRRARSRKGGHRAYRIPPPQALPRQLKTTRRRCGTSCGPVRRCPSTWCAAPPETPPTWSPGHPRHRFKLSDAQLTLALHHGFASWPRSAPHRAGQRAVPVAAHATVRVRWPGRPADELLRLACLNYGATIPPDGRPPRRCWHLAGTGPVVDPHGRRHLRRRRHDGAALRRPASANRRAARPVEPLLYLPTPASTRNRPEPTRSRSPASCSTTAPTRYAGYLWRDSAAVHRAHRRLRRRRAGAPPHARERNWPAPADAGRRPE